MIDSRPPPAAHPKRWLTGSNIALYGSVTVLSLVLLFPMYLIFLIAFVPQRYSFFAARPPLLPPTVTWDNFSSGLNTASYQFLPSMYLSLEVAFLVGLIALAIGIPTAYGLSRLAPRVAYGITAVLFVVNMLPSITIAIPIAIPFIRAHLYSTAAGVALAQELLALPVSVFLLVGAFQSLPRDLEPQARVDGAGRLTAIFGTLVPLIRPSIIAAFLLSWMFSWDESTFALILTNPANTTLPVRIFLDFTGRGPPAVAVAFSAVATVPVIILTIFVQKYLKGEDFAVGVRG